MEDVKSAAHALNDRSAGLDFEVSVVEGDDYETGLVSPKVRDTLMGKNRSAFSDDDSTNDKARAGGFCSCFTLAYYKPYFDVDTVDVQQRLMRALVPFKSNDPTFAALVATHPDAYGPFWLASTLVFCLASCSNVASFLDFVGDRSDWAYDFSRLATAYTLVQGFVLGLPLVLWALGKYLSLPLSLSFLLCVYGYGMAIFVPAAVACMAPVDAIDWVVLLLAMAWSLYFVLRNIWSVIAEHVSKEKMLPVLAFISAMHLLWAVTMKLLFF